MINKWDKRFIDICNEISSWSSCMSRRIGAILVRDKTIISTGYNGPPRGIPHCNERMESILELPKPYNRQVCPRRQLGYGSGEGLHLCIASHAEENCLINAARTGVCTFGSTMYMNCNIPCKACLGKIINAGVVEIVCESMSLYDRYSQFLLDNSNLVVRTYGKCGG